MQWDLLRTFEAVARLGSLTAAARALGSSQSTVSRHLARLEDVAGSPLLLREMPAPPVSVQAADLDGDGTMDLALNFEGELTSDPTRTTGWIEWRRPAPITHRLEAGGPQQRAVAAGAGITLELASERRYFEQVVGKRRGAHWKAYHKARKRIPGAS